MSNIILAIISVILFYTGNVAISAWLMAFVLLKCKIVSEYRKGKRTYVTVKMLDTGEVKRKILFPGNKRQGEDPTYSLYEICKVLYII